MSETSSNDAVATDGVVDSAALESRLKILRNLPVEEQNAAILEELATLTFTLQNAILRLQKQTKVDIRQEANRVRIETARVRRRVVTTIVTSVALALMLTVSSNNFAIKHCFLGTAKNLSHSTVCNTLFPGYNKQIDQEKIVLDQFNQILSQIPANKKTIDEIQRQLTQLQKQENARGR